MNEAALISVIVPIYNVSAYVERCIRSLVAQDYDNIEIIAVDDGSTDGSDKICDAIEQEDVRVHVLHKANGGLSDARNAGVQVSNGDYILFVDGDDYVDHDYVSSLRNALITTNTQIACSPLIFEYPNGKTTGNVSFQQVVIDAEHLCSVLYRSSYGIGVSACSKLMKRELLEAHPFPTRVYHEDMLVMSDITRACSQAVLVPHPTYHYIQHDTSITHKQIDFDSLQGGLRYLVRKAETTPSRICRGAYVHRMFGLLENYCRIIDCTRDQEGLREAQEVVRPWLPTLFADEETSLKVKTKGVLLCASVWSFSLLQTALMVHAKRLSGKGGGQASSVEVLS